MSKDVFSGVESWESRDAVTVQGQDNWYPGNRQEKHLFQGMAPELGPKPTMNGRFLQPMNKSGKSTQETSGNAKSRCSS
jgi:hypothetical protein